MDIPLTDLAALVAFLLVVGAIAGVLAGLLGVGGGIVIVPALFYVFSGLGNPEATLMHVCVATSLATILLTSARSMHSHNKKGAVDWAILRSWAPFIGLGAVIGVVAAEVLRSDSLMLVFGLMAMIVSLHMAFGSDSWRLGDAPPEGGRKAGLAGGLGFLSVLMGIGGGTFGLPLLTLYNVAVHRAVATAAGFGLIIAIPSVIGFILAGWAAPDRPEFTLGYVHVPAFAILVPMTVLCAPYGVKLAHSLNPRPLKLLFALFLFITALNMLRRALYG